MGSSIEKLAALVKWCGNNRDVEQARRVHDKILSSSFRCNVYLCNLLVEMYGKCGNLQDAMHVFNHQRHELNIISWNIMITAFIENGELQRARSLFDIMPERTLVSWNSMLSAYAGEGKLEEAASLFRLMPERDIISWTTMVVAFSSSGGLQEAKAMFHSMPWWNIVTWNVMLQGYAQNRELELAKFMFDNMPEWSILSWTSILWAYAHHGALESARKVFDAMPVHDIVCWNTIVWAYARNGCIEEASQLYGTMPEEAQRLFRSLQSRNTDPSVCDEPEESITDNVSRWNARIATLARLGLVKEARDVFDAILEKDMVSWNTMLAAQKSEAALECFSLMKMEGWKPDDVTFLCVLTACGHAGLLGQALQQFMSMGFDYEHAIRPSARHFQCLVDILSRSGHLREAQDVIHNMPYVPESAAWAALVGGYRNTSMLPVLENS